MMHANEGETSERIPSGPTPAGRLSAGTGELLPSVTLATPGGTPIALGQYSSRRNLVVLLLGAAEPDEAVARLLAQMVDARAAIEEEEAELLVVRPGSAGRWADERMRSSTVLVDGDAMFHRRMGAVDATGRATPALYITDRYREIYHAARPGDAQWPTSAEEVLSWLVFMNIQCPECGAPEW